MTQPESGVYEPPVYFRGKGGDPPVIIYRIFFPPNPPPLGVEIARPRGPASRGGGAPQELAGYVGEIFYAPLGARLASGGMKPELRGKLTAYRGLREALLSDLHDHLFGIKDADNETRLRLNTEMARLQAGPLAELEAMADQLRVECYRTRTAGGELDWNDKRNWKLGRGPLKRPREQNAVLEYQVQRAAAYFQEGLSPGQRRLLLEVAMELEDKVFRADSASVEEYGFVLFSPETARLRIPAGLSTEAVSGLELFERYKKELRSELRDAIYELDGVKFVSQRVRQLERLAKNHQPRVEALEELVEDIRRELVNATGFERPPAPPQVPPELMDMIQRFQQGRDRIQAELLKGVRAAQFGVERPPTQDPAEMMDYRDRVTAAAEEATRRFERENLEPLLELQEQVEAIAALIEEHVAITGQDPLPGSAERVMSAFINRQRKIESAFAYHTAVIEPGLAPEQRRLLFGAALRRMELPLPGGELQPTVLPGTLLPVDEVGR